MNIAEAVAEDKALRARRAEIMKELGRIDIRLVELARPPWIDATEVLAEMNAREAAARRVRHKVAAYTHDYPDEFIIGGVVYVWKGTK
jgi:predicted house-cleaning NTP pyrophosphatase (Maf/HAM1 superfamily)